MKKWSVDSNVTTLVKFDENLLDSQLKPMVYTLGQTPSGQYILVHTKERFDNGKLFGTLKARSEKILNTFNVRSSGTGVLLTGDKGSGKTLLSKVLANSMIDAGYPVILINQAFRGDGFNTFMDDIGQCCVLFDEFAKVYSSGSNEHDDFQDSLLTFFDGTMSSKRLCVVTENEALSINDFMKDRPGRMFYHFKYGKLDEQTINELCEATLKSDKASQLLDLSRKVSTFSFDILAAIIEESNRNPELAILSIAEDLNIPSISEFAWQYTVTKITDLEGTPFKIHGNPVSKRLSRQFEWVDPSVDYGDPEENIQYTTCSMYPGDIIYSEDNKVILEEYGARVYIKVEEVLLPAYSTDF